MTRGRSPAAPAEPPARDYDMVHLGALAAAVSVAFFRNFYTQGAILLYGDAVAHIHIARRVSELLAGLVTDCVHPESSVSYERRRG